MTAHILLVQSSDGVTLGVRFPSLTAARDWEDEHEMDVTVIGCVPVVTKANALASSR